MRTEGSGAHTRHVSATVMDLAPAHTPRQPVLKRTGQPQAPASAGAAWSARGRCKIGRRAALHTDQWSRPTSAVFRAPTNRKGPRGISAEWEGVRTVAKKTVMPPVGRVYYRRWHRRLSPKRLLCPWSPRLFTGQPAIFRCN